MVDPDLKSYTALFKKNALEEIETIRGLLVAPKQDLKTIHRICHSLKGQSFFMGFNDIGLKALELEVFYRAKIENSQTENINVESVLVEIEKLLITNLK